MSISSTPHTADPIPSPTIDTPLLPTATRTSATISAEGWQPQPTLTIALDDPIVPACVQEAFPDFYFLELQRRYELRDIGVDGNYNLTSLTLSGFYYLNGETVPESQPGAQQPLRANFGGQDMAVEWITNDARSCAHFTFTFQPDTVTPGSTIHGPLILTRFAMFTTIPRILISGVDVDLLLQSSSQATPTGGLDSGVDSSIGQSTNQTAAPASGNVPVSSSSSSSSPKASVLAPAIVVPVVVILAALAGFFLWRRHRRARLAPSAAFRADHADAVEAMERQGATVGLGGTGTTQLPTAGVSLPAQSSSYFPLDEKRPMGP